MASAELPTIYKRLNPPPGFWTYITATPKEKPEKNLTPVYTGKKWRATLNLNTVLQYHSEFISTPASFNDLEGLKDLRKSYYHIYSDNSPLAYAVFCRRLPLKGFSTFFPGYLVTKSLWLGPNLKILSPKDVAIELRAKTWEKVLGKAEKMQYNLEEG